MVHVESEGYRPVFDDPNCADCHDCVQVCPGAQVDGTLEIGGLPTVTEADREFGPTLEIWEGWATDPEIRLRASSGGVLSALSLYCLEHGSFDGVIHAGMDPVRPWLNENFVSSTREEVLARAGSRYSPSMPCAALGQIERGGRYVFVGKPCDAAAVAAMRRREGVVAETIGLVLTFFCAGTPSTRGTLDLLEHLQVDPQTVRTLHYRGAGWPGDFRLERHDDSGERLSVSYQESWGHLTSYRPLRCNLCPDGLGHVADISCGDAWQHYEEDGNPGRSLILVRTENGRILLQDAARAGYVTLKRVGASDVLRAQSNLLERRRTLFGRLAAFQLMGVPIPRYKGFWLLHGWLRSGLGRQVRSVGGTLRRIARRGWYRRRRQMGTELEAEQS